MGFRFRKSFSAGPFRVNLSKSGIGYSVGGKGFRFTKKAGGGTRTTASIPGTGISYVKDSKRKSTSKRRSTSKSKQSDTKAIQNVKSERISATGIPDYKKISKIAWILAAVFLLITLSNFSVFWLVITAFCALTGYANHRQAKKVFDPVQQVQDQTPINFTQLEQGDDIKTTEQEEKANRYIVVDEDWIKKDNFGVRSYRLTRIKKMASDGSDRLSNLMLCKINDSLTFRYDTDADGYVVLHEEYEIGELPRSANEACSCLPVSRMHGVVEEIDETDPEKVRVRVWFK